MGPATLILIAANVAVYSLQNVLGDDLFLTFALWPLGEYPVRGTDISVGFEVWQLFTSAFLHGSTSHLALNMLALWMFGRDVEQILGTRGYLSLYAAAVFTGSISQLIVVSMGDGPIVPTVGASGGVFGILLAFGMFFPHRTIVPLFPPIPMPARVFVALYAALELANGVLGTNQGVAHFAHLGGMVGAFLVLTLGRPKARGRP